MVNENSLIIIDPTFLASEDFLKKCERIKDNIRKKMEEISAKETPKADNAGNKIRADRPDGKEYIVAQYMATELDREFPGWSWRKAGGLQFLGSEVVSADGELEIIDTNLLAFGIIPPIRRYWAGDAMRIQFKNCPCQYSNKNPQTGKPTPKRSCEDCQGTGKLPHTPDNMVDPGDNVQSAITGAFKRAVNRLTHTGDDVYKKRLDYSEEVNEESSKSK